MRDGGRAVLLGFSFAVVLSRRSCRGISNSTMRERETERDRHRERERQRQTETQTDRQTESSHTYIIRHTNLPSVDSFFSGKSGCLEGSRGKSPEDLLGNFGNTYWAFGNTGWAPGGAKSRIYYFVRKYDDK